MRTRSHITRLISVFLLFALAIQCGHAQKLPVEHFASLPDVSQLRLSPDGQHLASVVKIQNGGAIGTAINVTHLNSGTHKIVLHSDDKKYRIKRIDWANNRLIFLKLTSPTTRYGSPTTETRLMTVDIKTKKTTPTISTKYLERFDYFPQIQDQIVDFLPDDNKHFLLQLDGYYDTGPSVFKVSLSKNKISKVQHSRPDITRWMTDRQHTVRIGIERKGTDYKILHRVNKKGKWATLWKFESFAANQVLPLGFDQDPNILYVNALHEGRQAIFTVNLKDPTLEKSLIYANNNYDVEGELLYSQNKKKVIGMETGDTRGYVFWDDDYKKLFNSINHVLKHTDNTLLGLSDDSQRYIVLAANDTDPGTYYFGDRATKSLSPIGARYSHLDPKKMASKQWIRYKARDGLEIEAALTLPNERKGQQKLPTIIFPHGGPISRSGDGFDYWTQFFANRGYAVLQMNFRGSSGYGHDFMSAGIGNWGLAMQDDVEDGAHWMIEHGYADPNKICIAGASYGGYAALMGAIKSPDLYQCAISFAGVTNAANLVKSSQYYTIAQVAKKQVGSNYKDLRERSPITHADKIKTPILLIHGTKDRRVNVKHSSSMNKALKKAGKEVHYIELENGTHFLTNNENRVRTFQEMDDFLAKYL